MLIYAAEERQELVQHLSLLKRNALAAPFQAAFEEQKTLQANYKEPAGAQQVDLAPAESKGELKIINYRESEAIFIQANHDRVTVIFSTLFADETDRVYGRTFLQVCGVERRHAHRFDTNPPARNLWTHVSSSRCRALPRLHTRTASRPLRFVISRASSGARTSAMSRSVSRPSCRLPRHIPHLHILWGFGFAA